MKKNASFLVLPNGVINGNESLQPKPLIKTDFVKIEINVGRFDPCRIGRNGVGVRIFPGLHPFHGFHAGAIGSADFQLTFDPFRVARWAMGIFYKHLTLLSLYPIKRDSALKKGTIRRAKPKRLHIEFSEEFVDALAKRNPRPSCWTRFPIYRNKGLGICIPSRKRIHLTHVLPWPD